VKSEIEKLINKSRRSLDAAKRLFNEGDFDFAVSSAYYSIFYVSEALLLNEGKSYHKHSAVMSATYSFFVKEGRLPKVFHSVLHEAYDTRQLGDYFSGTDITEEEAEKLIDKVGEQIKVAIEMLEKS